VSDPERPDDEEPSEEELFRRHDAAEIPEAPTDPRSVGEDSDAGLD
jgi:hypothetical protein